MNLTRTVVIGNSGSGKSWMSQRLAALTGGNWIDLDVSNWEPGGYGVARERQEVISMARNAASEERWVIEGIYGWIASHILPSATALLWIDLAESECVANIRRRGMRGGATPQSFAELVSWAQTYRSRTGSSSYAAHEALFTAFSLDKISLRTRAEVTLLAEGKFPAR
ncbi:adenylate kinase [Caballeronia sp. LZ019]|uniref:adenylate kinase n=1 Tax=Caballeronia sp. LZ019 TaxID=3038555 RepID=UPI002862B39D|nr:adenylate kinase [Caballeronia sp. LZ019]MDR5809117.1 adenylate kinase [Caballeronia sp. LZ019]